jgi:predicted Zn-dependent protease
MSLRPALNKFTFILFATSALAMAMPEGHTQTYRNLPRAGFGYGNGSLNSAAGQPLPKVNGLHLDEGVQQNVPQSMGGFRGGGQGQPYNPGEEMVKWQRVRWDSKKMPLLIWLSPGLQLPDLPFSQIQSQRVDMVTQMMVASPNWWQALPQAKNWTPETNDQVAAGIEQWREFEKEGLFSFAFTDDPNHAHIQIFFVDNFKESDAPGGIAVGGITSAQIYQAAQAASMRIRQKPVIIELSTNVNMTGQRMQGASAHEFGHALGIKAHSPNREDIMNVDRVVDFLSPSDKATIRWLYHQPLQWVM